ncbi:hypothetical protein BP5796_05814 [Coleophoma crateriformis]|uniref:Alpha/beta hydrolase fold-3 domain-containing protein n=1 Tax=Coleophoma crateriformis TaxID=565419 RepID=A0A3D8RV64_9HELO|nr:hypothetical protein BP5796_05814 [Coleophoma crateriformis]
MAQSPLQAQEPTPDLPNPLHPSVLARIDPQFAEIYTKYQAITNSKITLPQKAPHIRADQVTYEEYNADRSKYTFPIANGPSPEVQKVSIVRIPVSSPPGEIEIQIYEPTAEQVQRAGSADKSGRLPGHVNYHGGGWVMGGLKSDEPWCRQACASVGCLVFNIAYRLAPEHAHPTPVLDSWDALQYIVAHGEAQWGLDVTRVSVGGLSAGANIAAVLAILAREERAKDLARATGKAFPELVLQMLIVPAVDGRYVPISGSAGPDCPYESYTLNEYAPCLPLNRVRWCYNLWLGTDVAARSAAAAQMLASPMVEPNHGGVARASIHVAGVDPLMSEGVKYHEKLERDGVKSAVKVYEGVGHPFGHWDGELDKAKEFVRDSMAVLKDVYGLKDTAL